LIEKGNIYGYSELQIPEEVFMTKETQVKRHYSCESIMSLDKSRNSFLFKQKRSGISVCNNFPCVYEQ